MNCAPLSILYVNLLHSPVKDSSRLLCSEVKVDFFFFVLPDCIFLMRHFLIIQWSQLKAFFFTQTPIHFQQYLHCRKFPPFFNRQTFFRIILRIQLELIFSIVKTVFESEFFNLSNRNCVSTNLSILKIVLREVSDSFSNSFF